MPNPQARLDIQTPRLISTARRTFDIFISFIGLILLSPIFALIALLIKRDSPGPVFYHGRRAGRNGRIFHILKFRTMRAAPPENNGPPITAEGDPRVTRIGRVLRETKFNELPQLWNVLKGEMALVGPRPEDPGIAAGWPPEARAEILSVRPGITSPASVLYRDEEKLLAEHDNPMEGYLKDILPSKLRLDQLYVRHRTLLTDLDVLFWTAVVLLPRIRDRELAAYRLLSGPLSRFATRSFNWFMIDLPVAFAAVAAAGLLWRTVSPFDLGWQLALSVALLVALAFSIANILTGLNRIHWSKAPPAYALDLAAASAIVTVALVIADLGLGAPLPWAMLVVSGVFSTIGFVAVRYRARILTGMATRWIRRRPGVTAVGERILIIGAGELGEYAVHLVRDGDLSRILTIAGFVDDDPRVQDMRIAGLRVLGHTGDLPDLVRAHDIGLILYAIANIHPAERARILDLCRSTPARVVLVPNVLRVLRKMFSVDNLDQQVRVQIGEAAAADPEWLAELDELAEAGDLDAIRARIAAMQGRLTDNKKEDDDRAEQDG